MGCACSAASYEGDGVFEENGVWYFDSSLVGAGVYPIEAFCSQGSPDFAITVLPYPTIQISPSNPAICVGESVQLTASGVNQSGTWLWSPAAGLNSTTSPTVIASPAQTTTYTVTGTNGTNCSSFAQVTVVVTPIYTLSISSSFTTICQGVQVVLTLGGAPPGVQYEVHNSLSPSFNTLNGPTLAKTPEATITYWVELSGTSCFVQDEVEITVNTGPGLSVDAQPEVICAGQSSLLTATTDAGSTVSWAPASTLSSSSGLSVFASPQTTTTYTAQSVNSFGCVSEMDVLVIVEEICCVADLPPPTYLITSTTPDWVGQSYTLAQDLILQANVDFVINNCTLKFKNGTGIVLQEGADLSVINNSKLTLLDLCDPFWKGISAQRVSNYPNLVNWMRGKHLIEDNDFYCLPAPIFNGLQGAMFIQTTLSPITQESLDVANAPYGLYMDGPKGVFNVIDNHFETTIPGYGNLFSHGMIANNTGDNPNRVRRNVFTYMQRALKIQGDNRTDGHEDGLKYSCNFFDYNDSDIREVNSTNGNANTFGVPHQFSLIQPGNLIADPANNFTQSSSNCAPCGYDDLSNTMTSLQSNHRYYRLYASDPQDSETSPSPKIIIVPVSEEYDECESSKQEFTGNQGELSLLDLYQESTIALNELKLNYGQLVDGGNTNELLQVIQSASYSEALELYYDLMQESPNLSEEVLLESLSKLDLPNVLLTQILASNPHSLKNGRIAQAIEERPIQFDEYQKNQIQAGLNQFSSLEALEGLIAGIASLRGVCIQQLFEQIDSSDEIVDKLQSKLNLLVPESYVSDLFRQILVYEEYGQFAESSNSTTNAETIHKLSPNDSADLDNWPALMEIYQDRALAPEVFVLNEDQKEFLFNSFHTTSSIVSSRALQLLFEEDEIEYWEPIIEGAELRNLVELIAEEEPTELSLFPNPTHSWSQAVWHHNASSLEVLNNLGQIISKVKLAPEQRQTMLDMSLFRSGSYSILLKMDGDVTAIELIVKQ